MSPDETCSVCGRTILSGELTRGYLTPEGDRRIVCDLCRNRADRIGWVWEEVAGQRPVAAKRRPGGVRALFARGRGGRSVEEQTEDPVEVEPLEEPARVAPPADSLRPADPDPAAPGAHVRRREPEIPESPKSRLEKAAARFNASEASRTVAGLMRTLGEPWVSVGAAAGSPSEVRITVAWELSWYQWGVDLKDELRPIFPLDKGHEMDQLDGSARQWNATAAPGGQLFLGAPMGSPGQPVGG